MLVNQQILRLNSAGYPTAWISYETAARLYYTDQISYECGSSSILLRGGYNRITQLKSKLKINSIVATRDTNKLDYSSFTPSLSNSTLFKRDANNCLYCGQSFNYKDLSRDHVLPLSHGGHDVWTNVVTSCKRCNNQKGGRTPENANMMLLAIPFTPSRVEYLILRGRNK